MQRGHQHEKLLRNFALETLKFSNVSTLVTVGECFFYCFPFSSNEYLFDNFRYTVIRYDDEFLIESFKKVSNIIGKFEQPKILSSKRFYKGSKKWTKNIQSKVKIWLAAKSDRVEKEFIKCSYRLRGPFFS